MQNPAIKTLLPGKYMALEGCRLLPQSETEDDPFAGLRRGMEKGHARYYFRRRGPRPSLRWGARRPKYTQLGESLPLYEHRSFVITCLGFTAPDLIIGGNGRNYTCNLICNNRRFDFEWRKIK